MRNMFRAKDDHQKEPFREKLKEILWSYHKEPLTADIRRILEGVKSKDVQKLQTYDNKKIMKKNVATVINEARRGSIAGPELRPFAPALKKYTTMAP